MIHIVTISISICIPPTPSSPQPKSRTIDLCGTTSQIHPKYMADSRYDRIHYLLHTSLHPRSIHLPYVDFTRDRSTSKTLRVLKGSSRACHTSHRRRYSSHQLPPLTNHLPSRQTTLNRNFLQHSSSKNTRHRKRITQTFRYNLQSSSFV